MLDFDLRCGDEFEKGTVTRTINTTAAAEITTKRGT